MSTPFLLWRLITYCRWQFLADILLEFLVISGQLAFGLLIQYFFNTISPSSTNPQGAWLWILWLILAVALQCMMMAVTANISVGINFLQTALLQHNLLAHILARPGASADADSAGETISRFRDDTASIVGMTSTIIRAIGGAFFALGAFGILFHANAMMTLLVFLPLLCIIIVAQRMKKRQKLYRRASRQATSNLTSAINEVFSAIQVIQMAGTEKHVLDHLKSLNERRRIVTLKETVFTNILQAIFGNTADIGKGLILVLVAISFHTQTHVGDLALFIAYLGNISDYLQIIGAFLAQYAQTKVSHQRLTHVLRGGAAQKLVEHDTPLPIQSKELLPPPPVHKPQSGEFREVRAVALTYQHPDTGRGIRNINLCLKKRTMTVIAGKNGSGKTTLLQVFLGLLPLDKGEIFCNGRHISDPASFFVPPFSAYTSQRPRLFSGTIKENILQGLPEEMVDVQQALYTAVLEHDVNMFEQRLDTIVGSRGVKLSGGQIQRVAAARMLVHNAELLVFDDLSSALDIETENLLWERLFEQHEHTYLVVSNRKAVLQRADHILMLRDGEIIAEGSLATLLKTCEEMQQLLR